MTIKKGKGLICIPELVKQVMLGTYKDIDEAMNVELIISKTSIKWNTLQILRRDN